MTFNSVISKRANISVWSALIASQKAKLVSLVFRKKDWLNTAREDEGMSLGYQRKLNESHNGIKHSVWDVEQRAHICYPLDVYRCDCAKSLNKKPWRSQTNYVSLNAKCESARLKMVLHAGELKCAQD